MQSFRSLIYGLTLPLLSLRVILKDPKLLILSILPIVTTFLLYGFLISSAQDSVRDLVVQHFQTGGWAAWIVLILVKILLIIVGALTFSFVASVASSPFNDFLAERAEKHAVPALPQVPSMPLGRKAVLIAIDLGKSLAAGIAMLAALLLSWVPVVNVIALVVSLLLVTFQFISYPQTRRGLGLGEGVRFLGRHFFACLGFGLAFTFLFSLPLISAFFLPLAVVGGTLLVARAPGLS
jgi:uncharacterized protein involved in cysteine biosynthesis